jgi:hypothetical protein
MKENYLPTLKKTRVEYFESGKEAVERYNELLNMPNVYSLFLDPVKNAKGYWSVEIQEYTSSWLDKYDRR